MSDQSTKRLLEAYFEQADTEFGFLSGFFTSPRSVYHMTETVEIDIKRSGREIAIPVPDLSVGPRMNEDARYSNKEYTPPIYKEAATLNAFDMLRRQPGDSPFQEPAIMAAAQRQMFGMMDRLWAKVSRGIELQAAQVLQTGAISLTDAAGSVVYSIDYLPKAPHFPTAASDWSGASDKIEDLRALCEQIHIDGKTRAFRAIFGEEAFGYLMSDTTIANLLDNRRIDRGGIGAPQTRGMGGTYHGTLSVGDFTLEVWTYSGRYDDPQTGNPTRYLTSDNVIIMGNGRLHTTWGGIPRIVSPDPRVAPLVLGGRVSSADRGVDMHPWAWVKEDGSSVVGQVEARPLCVPVSIDTFGCLNTVA